MTTLTNAIHELKNTLKNKLPEDIIQVMANATNELKQSDLVANALKTGDTIPDFSLFNQHHETRRFYDYLNQGPVILNIYRGGWCPYCNLEMKAFHDILPKIKDAGAQLIGLSPELPEKAINTQTAAEIDIDILFDEGNQISQKLGLVFKLADTLKPIYQSFGIDLPVFNGDDSFTLPLPATYLIDKKGKIIFHFIDVDYTQRLEPSQLLPLIPK